MEEDTVDISPPHLLPIYSLSRVQQFLSSNQFSQAYEFYTNQINSESKEDQKDMAEIYINRSFIDLALQMTKNALEDANKAIQIDQYASPAYFVIGLSHLWNGNEENALAIWRTGLENTKELSYYTLMTALVNSLNFRAHLYKMKFDVNHVLDLVDDFANPRYTTDSNIQDAFSELRSSSYESAIEHFTMILKVNPQNHYAYKGRGVAYCMLGHYYNCIKDLTTAIEKMPSNFQIDTVKVRAMAYAAIGNITGALFDLNKYLLFVPDDYEAKIEIAKLNMKRKTYIAAHKIFLSIPEKEIIKNEDSLLSFSECLYAVGELNNASLVLNRIEKMKNHKYHYISYLIHRDLNQIEKAEAEIIEAVKLVPTFFLNRSAADFFCDIGEVEKSIEYYREALQQCPYDAETHLFYAHALFETGKLGESALMLQELTIQNEKFKFRGSLDHFNKMNFGLDLLNVAQSDFCFIQTAIMSIDTSIMNLQHGFFQPQMANFNQLFPNLNTDKNSQISPEKEKQVDDKELVVVEDVTDDKNDQKDDQNQHKEKLTNNIQKIEELKNRLAKFYINAMSTDDSKSSEASTTTTTNTKDDSSNNENNNDNENDNDKNEGEIYCDENDLNNQKLEKKIEREMLNYLFGKEYSNEIDKDEMHFNECLDKMIALNGKENENSANTTANYANFIPYLSKSYSNQQAASSQPDSASQASSSPSEPNKIDQSDMIHSNFNQDYNSLFLKQINNDFKLSPLNLTSELVKMVKDADRLGQRCITHCTEKTVNKRLARCLGFCVLRIAYMMKTQWFSNGSNNGNNDQSQKTQLNGHRHWLTAFEEVKSILQFADMRNPIKFNCSEPIPSSSCCCSLSQKGKPQKFVNGYLKDNKSVCHFCSPTYYIMKNGRISARFGFLIEKVFLQIKQQFPAHKIESFEDVYQTTQCNFVSEAKLEVNDATIDLPQIVLKYNGIYGFDLFLRPLTDIQSWKVYDIEMQNVFCELMKKGENSTLNLAYFIILIWLRQPLNFYSPEIGHTFLHAFVLASNDAEIGPIDESNGENFIIQMVNTSIGEFSDLLYEHALKNKLESQFSEESLKYWALMPSISTMIQLLNVSYE